MRVDPKTMDISQCLKMCTGGCSRIQVTRASNLPTTVPNTIVNLPYTAWNASQYFMQVLSGPCGYLSVSARVRAGCKVNTTQMAVPMCSPHQFAPDDYVCFTSGEVLNETLQATPSFAAVSEPEDPRFYSTCLLKSANYGFSNYPSYPQPQTPWQAGTNCVPCNFLTSVSGIGNHTVPNWETVVLQQSGCTPCY